MRNLQESVIEYEFSIGKLISLVLRVDERGCIIFALYVMYGSVGNSQESVIPYKFPMEKLVGMVKNVDVRRYILCACYVNVRGLK